MAGQKQKNALDKRIRSRKKSVCSAGTDYVIVFGRQAATRRESLAQ